jgi:hypothetical protein
MVQRWTSAVVSPADCGGFVSYGDYLYDLREEVANEREACAKLCELEIDTSPDAELSEWSRAHNNACRTRAAAIRMRGYTP